MVGQFNLIEKEVRKFNRPGYLNAFNVLGADIVQGLPYEERVSATADGLEALCFAIAKERFLNPDTDWELVLFAIVETLLARYDLDE